MATAVADVVTVAPPKQARSRKTFERILDGLEALLRERPFEEITVRELMKRSCTSVGSFYARFPTKDALLPALYDRHDSQLQARGAGRPRRTDDLTLDELVDSITHRLVRRHRERKWFIRAVALHARQHPELIPAEQRRRRTALHREWRSELLRHRESMRHPEPETAVAFGLFMCVSACREKIVFADAPHAASFKLSDRCLAQEMTRAFLAYVGTRPVTNQKEN